VEAAAGAAAESNAGLWFGSESSPTFETVSETTFMIESSNRDNLFIVTATQMQAKEAGRKDVSTQGGWAR